ncbi:hypothetical protein BC358_04270 [Hydrogenophaga sp. H7]|nr:hypothetical protein BC358_04270 [Hydrogenophaga sp. H7]
MTDSCVFFWALKASDCAAWVQAWGTLAALAVSIGVWWWQSSRAREDRVQAEIERLTERVTPALGLLEGMLHEFHSIVAELEGRVGGEFFGWQVPSKTKFLALLNEYSKVEAHLLPDANLALEAARAKELGATMRQWIGSFEPWPAVRRFSVSPNHVKEAKSLHAALSDCRDAMRKRLVERSQLIINPDLKRSPVVDAD